jgi:hypothetical protein
MPYWQFTLFLVLHSTFFASQQESAIFLFFTFAFLLFIFAFNLIFFIILVDYG